MNLSKQMPVSIKIKNNSDDKHYAVKVFDYDHERQDKITYESGIPDVSYGDVLRRLASLIEKESNCGMIYLTVYAGYEKFKRKQLLTTIFIKHTDLDGSITKSPIVPAFDPYQQQSDIIVFDKVFAFDKTLQVELESLLPEAEVHLRFYLSEVNTDTGKEPPQIQSLAPDIEAIKKVGRKSAAKKPVKK